MKKLLLNLLLIINLAIIIMFWWMISGKLLLNNLDIITVLVVFGRIAGLLAVYFILIQLLLIGRIKWIEKVFGFDRLSIIHHWFGITAFLLIIFHFIFLTAGYAKIYSISWLAQISDFIFTGEELFPAIISLILFTLIVVGSIALVKKRMKYEYWYYLHLATYLAILLAYGHQLELGFDLNNSNLFAGYWVILYLFVIINFVYYRFVWPIILLKKHQFYVDKIVSETDEVVSIYIKGNRINEFNYKAGQFAFFRFINKKNLTQAHPYSFSDVPGKDYLRITIKKLGDGSGDVKNIIAGTRVVVDGPIGIFTEKEKTGDSVLLIAGGVGITPIRALIEQLAEKNKNLVLLYSVKKNSQIIFKEELENLKLKYQGRLVIHYIISEEKNLHGFNRIDRECISCLVPDVNLRVVYLCGPTGMTKSLKKHLINLGINKSNIYYEKFSL